MAFAPESVIYVSRNRITGLTNITARVLRDGTEVASGIALTEVSSTNWPGAYRLDISLARFTAWGGRGKYEFHINSATQNAPANIGIFLDDDNFQSIEDHLVTQDAAIASVKSDTSSIKTSVDDGTIGLSAIKTAINALASAVSNIQNNTRFAVSSPDEMIKPASGTTPIRILGTLFDEVGNPEDPDSNSVTLQIKNPSGADVNTEFGLAAGPVALTRLSQGVYQIDLAVASTATLQQVTLEFSYTENAVALKAYRSSSVIADVQASGFALQSTLLSAAGTGFVSANDSLVALSTLLRDASFGLAAIRALEDTISAATIDLQGAGFATANDSNKALSTLLRDASFGLQAIRNAITSQATAISDVQGAGFSSATDSLKAISDRTFQGGQAY